MPNIPRGTPLTIINENARQDNRPGLPCAFELSLDDEYIVISAPEPNRDMPINRWDLLTVSYGLGATRYVFCAQVLDYLAEGLLILLRVTGKVICNQRRGDVRLEVLQEVKGLTVPTDGVSPTVFSGTALDVSLSGLSLHTDMYLQRFSRVNLSLPNAENLRGVVVAAEVRWTRPAGTGGGWLSGCLFQFSHLVTKERFSRYIRRVHHNRLVRFAK
ncbi:hypothetical protein FACS1894217_09620 [Clostridia bacterium]|nr:hypothetical protein FACS1894217_09620 [Clostridia bacterium]